MAAMGLVLAGSVFTYQRAFSTFAEYDDEGYIMLSLDQYLEGHALYDEVYSQYGPAWYLLQSAVHGLTGLPVTHDITRAKTVLVWLLAAALAGLIAHRITGNRAVAMAAATLGVLHLDRLVLEPGHPQELCLLVMLAGVLLLTSESLGVRRQMVIGLLLGVAVMTKPNVGLLLVASATVAVCAQLRSAPQRRWSTISCGVVIALGVFVVTRSTFAEPGGLQLPIVVAGSVLTVAMMARRGESSSVEFRSVLGIHAGWVAGASGLLLLTVLSGSNLAAALDGIVFQHLGFADRFYTAAPIYPFAAPLTILSCCLVALFGSRPDHTSHIARYARLCLLALFAGIAIRQLGDVRGPLEHGLDDRGHAGLLVSLVAPFAWVVLVPVPGETWSAKKRSGRIALASVAVLQPLVAYPTPGTQMAIGSLALLLITLISLHDLVAMEAAEETPGTEWFARLTNSGLAGVPVALLVLGACSAAEYRSRLEPLQLHGAQHLRLPPAQVHELRALVHEIRKHGDTFISLHNGYNSLYLFADVDPPSGMNATFWPWMLSEPQQEKILRGLKSADRICRIEKVIPERPESPGSGLTEFLAEGFRHQATIGLWEVWSGPGR